MKKIISVLLSVVLIFGSLDTIALANPKENIDIDSIKLESSGNISTNAITGSYSNLSVYPSKSLKTISITTVPGSGLAVAYGKILIFNKPCEYSWDNKYVSSGVSDWSRFDEEYLKANKGLVKVASPEYCWTDGPHSFNLSFYDNEAKLNEGDTYYIYLWTRSDRFGIYPETLITSLSYDDLEDYITPSLWFDGNNGTVSTNFEKGTVVDPDAEVLEYKFTEPTAPTRTNFEFGGWYKEPECINKFDFETTLTETITLYAKWISTFKYYVYYKANGGTGSMNSDYFRYDTENKLKKCTLTKKGYQFMGWSTSSTSSDVAYQNEATVINLPSSYSRDTSYYLYAVWVPNKYKIKYDSNGGLGNMPSQTLTYDKSSKLSSNIFTKPNYTFVGWATEEDKTKVAYFDNNPVLNMTDINDETITLYAVWSETPVSYRVEHYKQKLNSEYNDVIGTEHNTTNYDIVSIDTKTIVSYAGASTTAVSNTYTGFSVEPFEQQIVNEDGSTVIKIYYKRNKYSLKFYKGTYGSWPMSTVSLSVYYGVKASKFIPDNYDKSSASTYKFNGWKIKIGGVESSSIYTTIDTIVGVEEVYITARWKGIPYTVIFDYNYPGGSVSTYNCTYGNTQYASGVSRTGYTHQGWAKEPDSNTISYYKYNYYNYTTVENDIVHLYAIWKPITYKVQFNANGGEGTMSNQTVAYDVLTSLTPNTFTRENYKFLGWGTSSSDTKSTYSDGASVLNLKSSQDATYTLYAIWTQAETTYKVEHYKQKLNSDQSSIIGEDINDTNYELDTSATQTLAASAGATTNASAKSFSGFSIAGAIEQETVAEDGSTVVKIYYKRNSYTLTFNQGTQGDWELSPVISNVYYGCKISNFIPENYSKSKVGYKFRSWGQTLPITMDNSNRSYTASWDAIKYTIRYNANGGTGSMSDTSMQYDSSKSLSSNTFTYPGHTFLGWNTDSSADTILYSNGRVISNLTTEENAIIDLYAIWEKNTNGYTVEHYKQRLNDDNTNIIGTEHNDNNYELVEEDTKFYKSTDAKTSATIKSYNGFQAEPFEQLDIAEDGSTVVKIYYSRKKYPLSFNQGDHGNWATSPIDYQVYYGCKLADYIPEDYKQPAPGYMFSSMNVAETMPYNSLTYKPTWTPISYSIKFDSNGGSNMMGSISSVKYDANVTLLQNQYTKIDYEFMGWALSSSAKQPMFKDKAIVKNLTTVNNSTVTLYAVWSNNVGSYKVEHYKQRLSEDSTTIAGTEHNDNNYELVEADSEEITASVGELTEVQPKEYTGFSSEEIEQEVIKEDGSTVIKVYYNRNQYELEFDQGIRGDWELGQVIRSVYYGAKLPSAPADYTKCYDGYIFTNWDVSLATTMPNSNLRYTAMWRAITYTIKFNPNGGNDVVTGTMPNLNMTYEIGAALPSNTYSRENCDFLGWSNTPNAIEPLYSDKQIVKNLTIVDNDTVNLYAVWENNNYNGTYKVVHYKQKLNETGDSIIGTEHNLTNYELVKEDLTAAVVGELTNAVPNVYEGFKAAAFDQAVVEEDGSTTINIYYDRNQHELKYLAGLKGDWAIPSVVYNVYYGAKLPSAPLDYNKGVSGYQFSKWDSSVASIMGNDDLTYIAIWDPISYKIKFNSNKGNAIVTGTMSDISAKYDTPINLTNNSFVRQGYKFIGWADSADSNTVLYNNGASVNNLTTINNDIITLYAVWEALDINYVVKHYKQKLNDSNDGVSGTEHNDTNYEEVVSDKQTLTVKADTMTEAIAKTYEGFKTPSVTQEIVKLDGSTVISLYYDRNQYTVTFDQGSKGNWSNQTVSNQLYYGCLVTVPSDYTNAATGYKFSKWDSEVVSNMGAKNLTYTAEWDPISYQVRFNANGGEGTMSNLDMVYDQPANLTKNSFSNGDYSFGGWALNDNALTATYLDEASVKNLATEDSSIVDLYAIWVQTNATYTVKHYKQKLNASGDNVMGDVTNDTNYEMVSEQTLNGEIDELTSAQANTYEGFSAINFDQEIINDDNSTIVNIYYARNVHNVVLEPGQHGAWKDSNNNALNAVSVGIAYGANLDMVRTKLNEFDYTLSQPGYKFKSWDNEFVSLMPNEDIKYTATHEGIKYTVRFDNNGGEGDLVDDISLVYDNQELCPNASLTKKGFSFVGFDMNPNAILPKYKTGDIIENLSTVDESVVTLYATWKPVRVNVSFLAIEEDVTGSIEPVSYGYTDEVKKLPTSGFNYAKHKLVGFKTQESSKIYTELNREFFDDLYELNLINDDENDIVLNPVWEESLIEIDAESKEILLSAIKDGGINKELKHQAEIKCSGLTSLDEKLSYIWESDDVKVATVKLDSATGKIIVSGIGYGETKVNIYAKGDDGEKIGEPLDSAVIKVYFNDVTRSFDSAITQAIGWVADNNITGGYNEKSLFKPEDPTRRDQFAIFLYRHYKTFSGKEPEYVGHNFSDVKNPSTSDTYKAISWCAYNGIVGGYKVGNKLEYRPTANVTRLQVMIMLYKYAKLFGVNQDTSTSKLSFKDTGSLKVGSASYNAVLWGYEKSITAGTNGYFQPNNNCQRQQLVVMLYKFHKLK